MPVPNLEHQPTQPTAAGFFQCMRCSQALPIDGSSEILTCSNCGATIPLHDTIIDFATGSVTTALDSIDYDEKYGINEEHSLNLYHLLLRATGPLWPKHFGDALEVGCGTGGLSLALLSNISADHIVMTDISPKMLRLCRSRLRAAGNLPTHTMTFATYSGTEDCFRPNVFDTCFGTAVVHHITEVPRFLGHVHSVLKPGGCAFFMEPNQEFHRALTATLADIIAEVLRNQSLSDADLSRMLNWTGEVHCNIVNSGDIEVLAEREDKHLFVGGMFEDWAKTVGFTNAAALPCDPDPTGWKTIQTYFDQSHISAEGLALVKQWWTSKQVHHFNRLEINDQSPSYLFWLRKPLHPSAIPAPRAPTPVSHRQRPAIIALDLGLIRHDHDLELSVRGWCLSAAAVRSVQITACDVIRRLPVWRPRADVQKVMNADAAYPPLHALCSGIEGTIRLHVPHGDTIQVSVDIVPVDGPLLPARTISLTVGEKRAVSGTFNPATAPD